MTRTNSDGYLHWVLPAMIGLGALTILLSGRDLSLMFRELESGSTGVRDPIIVWGQRAMSVLLVGAAAERMVNHIIQRRQLPSPMLALAFVVYWLATVAAPALLGSHPELSHEYLYTLLIGMAFVITTAIERDRIIDACRNALIVFLLASVLLIPIAPAMVLDASYTQGLLPGVPRLGGLANHPVALGMLAEITLLLLWAHPLKHRWLNMLSWLLVLFVLVLAQSKTAWGAFLICSACMLALRHGPSVWRRLGDPREGAFGIVVCVAVLAGVSVLLGVVLFGDLERQLGGFADTAQGAQLISLTGRDQIWAIAIEEWQANRLFGYGPGLWDYAFRVSIGMPHAINAHNQFMDTLARSGTVGATVLVLYASVLLVLSLRHARATSGLSMALFLALALLSISEVPLMLFAYGSDLLPHLLLLVVLPSAGAGAARLQEVPSATRPVYRTAL